MQAGNSFPILRRAFLIQLMVILTICIGGVVRADVIVLNPTKDTTLYDDSEFFSNGAGSYMFTGQTNGTANRRALMKFDIAASIPAGSTINSASLQLYMSRTQAGDEIVRLHVILADWGEGLSNPSGNEGGGTLAEDNDATWRYRFFDTNDLTFAPQWTTLGGDYNPTPSGSTTVGGSIGNYTWSSSFAMVAAVQSWLNNPATNYGWIAIGDESTAGTSKRYDSRHSTTSSRRPRLTINFTPPAASGACCFSNGSCQVLTSANCGSMSGTYQGDATSCSPNPCPQPMGACCFADGSCQVLGQNDCVTASGTYQGDDTDCSPNPCPQPTGACCFDDGTCQVMTSADCATQDGNYQGDSTACTPNLCPIVLTPFIDPLPIPPLATPTTGTQGGEATYDMDIVQVQQQLHSELPPTTLWTYEGMYPGPTILATRDVPVTVNWINDLRDEQNDPRTDHYLTVDPCAHGAANEPKVVVHLHGGHVPAAFDGYPESTFLPGDSETYVYPNNQLPGLIWYHDHALGITRLNVYMGLAGGYVITDAFEQSLNLPSGEYDVPLIIQDRMFNPDGSLYYPAALEEHFFGDKMLVNGKVWPYLNVKQGKYRFRALNGCNSRTLTLSLSNAQTFEQIGTDGGLLPAPVTLSQVTLGPAERADIIVDFSALAPATEIVLTNSAASPFPSGDPMFAVPDVMKFVVQAQAGHTDAIPGSLRSMETLDPMDAVTTRNFVLRKLSNPCTGSMWLINDLQWDDITEYPVLGTTEIWSFINRSGISHPMHMHLVFFQILDRQDFQIVEGEVVPIGSPVAPAANEAGWKDTVMAHPYQITRVIARFEDYTGLYPYHCHILEHEDHEMMRQFEAVCIKGDTNQDTLVDGRDISLFVEAISGTVDAGTAQFCATDMDSNLALETAYDIDLFVDCLVAGNCP